MAKVTESTHVYTVLHGSGVANCGAFPYIGANFDIYLERENGSSTVTWYIDDNDYAGDEYGSYGFHFYAAIAINPVDPNNPDWDTELYTIIEKDDTTGYNWWTHMTMYEPSGSLTLPSTEAKLYLYVKNRDSCYNGSSDNPCYYGPTGTWFLIDSVKLNVPEYETFYDVIYDANGGSSAPSNQKKSSLSDLTLSNKEPTYTLSINYYNQGTSAPSDETTADRAFNYWDAYHSCDDSRMITFVGDGSTTTYPTTTEGFSPSAVTITEVRANHLRVPTNQYSLVNNHIVFTSATMSGVSYAVYYKINPIYSDPDSASPYRPSGLYQHNQKVWMVANWGSASFIPIALPDNYITITFNYNGGTGTPAVKTILRAPLGYDTNPSSSSYPYTPGVSASTTTNLNLYPKYGNATLPYAQLPVPTRAGFHFEGWYYDPQLTNKIVSDVVTDHSITIYAKWKALPIHKRNTDGTWGDDGPYVWQCVEENGQKVWKKIAHVYKFDGTNWVDLSI